MEQGCELSSTHAPRGLAPPVEHTVYAGDLGSDSNRGHGSHDDAGLKSDAYEGTREGMMVGEAAERPPVDGEGSRTV
eukprot:365016-Chlamydomonas_euryale.AAC.8